MMNERLNVRFHNDSCGGSRERTSQSSELEGLQKKCALCLRMICDHPFSSIYDQNQSAIQVDPLNSGQERLNGADLH